MEPVLATAVVNQFFLAHSLTRFFGFWRELLVCFGGGVCWFGFLWVFFVLLGNVIYNSVSLSLLS